MQNCEWHGTQCVDRAQCGDGSAAHRKGLRAGDEVISVRNKSVWEDPSAEIVKGLQPTKSLLRVRRPAPAGPSPQVALEVAEPTPEQMYGGAHWLGCQAIELCPAVTEWRALKCIGGKETIDLMQDARTRSWVVAPVFKYCEGQPLRIWSSKTEALGGNGNATADTPAAGHWRELLPSEASAVGTTSSLCEAHHAPALLTPAGHAAEHTRFVRHVQDKLGTHLDAFSGTIMDLRAQMATIQYKEDAERQALLVDADPKDFEVVDADVLERQRKGSTVAEIRRGAVDASQLLDDVMAPSPEWAQGCYATQPCVVVLGPAAQRKTTLLRRFVVEAVERPEQVVPIFAAVIDIVRHAKESALATAAWKLMHPRSSSKPWSRMLRLLVAQIARATSHKRSWSGAPSFSSMAWTRRGSKLIW